MTISCKRIDSRSEFVDAIRLRVEVFINEQGCAPGWEPDEHDRTASQYGLFVAGELLVTARVREPACREFKIERMATRKDARRKGLGAELMRFILKDLEEQRPARIWMQSQTRAKSFYQTLGFKECSEEYVYAEIPHVDMEFTDAANSLLE